MHQQMMPFITCSCSSAAAAERNMYNMLLTTLYAPLHQQLLEEMGAPYVLSLFEADSQLAYMAINGLVYAVVTVDSDLAVYGCPRVRENMMDIR